MVDRLDQKLPEVKAETLSEKLGVLKGQTTLRGAQIKTLPLIAQCIDQRNKRHTSPCPGGSTKNIMVFTLEHVKAKRLVTHWVMCKARERICDTLSDSAGLRTCQSEGSDDLGGESLGTRTKQSSKD